MVLSPNTRYRRIICDFISKAATTADDQFVNFAYKYRYRYKRVLYIHIYYFLKRDNEIIQCINSSVKMC